MQRLLQEALSALSSQCLSSRYGTWSCQFECVVLCITLTDSGIVLASEVCSPNLIDRTRYTPLAVRVGGKIRR